jgi:pimeloyl-ACP methyl ester carboxylesterase
MTDRSVMWYGRPMTTTLDTSTGPIAYDVRGGETASESLPTIVMLPSGAHDRHDFDELRALLGPRFRTISLDWPAHGESPAGSAPATAMRFADVAEVLVEQLAPEGAIVLGNSVGGFSAARLAIRRPELVKGLVLVDAGGFLGRAPQVRAFCALMGVPRFLRAIYPMFSKRYMRSRTTADARARNTAIATTRNDRSRRRPCSSGVGKTRSSRRASVAGSRTRSRVHGWSCSTRAMCLTRPSPSASPPS